MCTIYIVFNSSSFVSLTCCEACMRGILSIHNGAYRVVYSFTVPEFKSGMCKDPDHVSPVRQVD